MHSIYVFILDINTEINDSVINKSCGQKWI